MRNLLRTFDVQLPSEELALVASTSAAAKIFEKGKTTILSSFIRQYELIYSFIR